MRREYLEGVQIRRSIQEPLIPGMRNQDGKLEQILRLIAAGWSFNAISILTQSHWSTVKKAAEHLKAVGIKVPSNGCWPKAGRRKRADGRKVVAWGPWWHLEKSA